MAAGYLPIFARRIATAASFAGVVAISVSACGTGTGGPGSEPLGTSALALTTATLPLFNTGVDALGAAVANGATDLHYSITASTDATRTAPRAAIVSAPNGAWVAPAAAKWVSLDAAACTGCANATYTYATTFAMPANMNLSTAMITLNVAADDTVRISLNGTQVFSGAAYGATTNVAIGPNQAAFADGTNTLTFADVNSGGGPAGLLVEAITGSVNNGCTQDSNCTTADFCNTVTATCTPKLANGTAIPTIAGHTPALAGMCSGAVGTAVCTGAVCDTTDNECGYANGDGPCTGGTAAAVCRSGACSASSLICVPTGGCAADADCPSTQYCNTPTLTCASKLANGVAIPTVVRHVPALAGLCTGGAATSVCVAGVCDTADNECGYKNRDGTCTAGTAAIVCRSGACDPGDHACGFAVADGPCTVANEATVCRSQTCSAGGLVCIPVGGCETDSDCSLAQYCSTPAHVCLPKLANGVAIPSIAGHLPSVAGACTALAGASVCAAGVCDVRDNACGYINGDGACTSGNAATVCRSGVCDPGDLECGLANGNGACTLGTETTVCRSDVCTGGVCSPATGCAVDANCSVTQYCNTVTPLCAAKLANGTPIPTIAGHTPPLTGACTPGAGVSVCTSGVCDGTDNKCGLNNGEACSQDAACRSLICGGGLCRAPGVDGGAESDAGPDASIADAGSVGPADGGPDSSIDAGLAGAIDSGTDGSPEASANGGVDSGMGSGEGPDSGAADVSIPNSDDGGIEADASEEDMGDAANASIPDATAAGSNEAEANPAPDSGTGAIPPPEDDGFVEGGGIRCSAGPGSAGSVPARGLMLGLGLAVASLRRRRGRKSSR